MSNHFLVNHDNLAAKCKPRDKNKFYIKNLYSIDYLHDDGVG